MIALKPIYHIASRSDLERARRSGTYSPAAFAEEGFIHCSYAEQIAAVANSRFRGRRELVLMRIDAFMLPVPIVNENLEGGAELFPHVYAPLPLSAVIRVDAMRSREDGSFDIDCLA